MARDSKNPQCKARSLLPCVLCCCAIEADSAGFVAAIWQASRLNYQTRLAY
jgi:hypothetical protein